MFSSRSFIVGLTFRSLIHYLSFIVFNSLSFILWNEYWFLYLKISSENLLVVRNPNSPKKSASVKVDSHFRSQPQAKNNIQGGHCVPRWLQNRKSPVLFTELFLFSVWTAPRDCIIKTPETREGGSKRTLPPGPQFLVRTQRRSEVSPMAKITLLKKEHLKGKVSRATRVTGARMMSYGVFKTELLYIHLGGHRLTVLIDSCNFYSNMLYCTCLSNNSVC